MAPAPRPPRAAMDAVADTLRSLTFDHRMAAGLFAAMALLPLASPLLGGGYVLHIAERALILAVAAISLELLIGVGGMVSFGHAAFLGIGAYAAGIAASHGLGTLAIALPAALAASAVFALLTGAIAVRTHGVYFIMITLAFGQMAFFVATSLAPYGGDDGLAWPGRTLVLGTEALENETAFFYVTLAAAAAAYVLASRLTASRFGRVLRGLTGSETRLQAIGFAPYPFRLTAYVIAGTICGFAGFLLGNNAEFVSPAYMHWQRSGELIVIVLLGGTGTAYGPVLGAVAFVVLEEVLSGLTEHWKAILGPILVLVVLFAKGGLAGGIEHAAGRWRRRKPSASELGDTLVILARQQAARWWAAATARWDQAGTAARRQGHVLLPAIARALGRMAERCRPLASAFGHQRNRFALSFARGTAIAREHWHPWIIRQRRRADALRPMAEQGIARLAQESRGLVLASRDQLDRLVPFVKDAAADARGRWRSWKMALGRRLVSLVLLAERSIADAVQRWRRR